MACCVCFFLVFKGFVGSLGIGFGVSWFGCGWVCSFVVKLMQLLLPSYLEGGYGSKRPLYHTGSDKILSANSACMSSNDCRSHLYATMFYAAAWFCVGVRFRPFGMPFLG